MQVLVWFLISQRNAWSSFRCCCLFFLSLHSVIFHINEKCSLKLLQMIVILSLFKFIFTLSLIPCNMHAVKLQLLAAFFEFIFCIEFQFFTSFLFKTICLL